VSENVPPGVVSPAIVDTDVLSFWQRKDTRGAAYSRAVAGRTLVISFQTVAELLRWAAERNWGDRRRAELEEYLKRFLVYPYSLELAREWADIMAGMAKAGRPMKAGDAWIAATARLIGAPLVTNNRKDFEPVPGLTVISFAPVHADSQ
jgi:predicted nucleic acid-binding protein